MIFRAGDHLVVRLAERWYKLNQQLTSYRDRVPLISDWQFTDGAGQPLTSTVTTYPHRLDCQTEAGVFSIAFVDAETVMIALPAGQCGLTFKAAINQGRVDRRGGTLHTTGDIRRNVAYTTNARPLLNLIDDAGSGSCFVRLEVESDGHAAVLINITPRLGFNRWVPEPESVLEAAARRWHDWFAAAPVVEDKYLPQYYYAWWIMRAGLISTWYFTTREAMTPSKLFYVGVWQWDAYFHALAYRHVNMKLAQDQIRILLDHQRDDGMIPDAIHDEGTVTHLSYPVDADVTKPPLLAWAAWKIYETGGDREFLSEIYEPLVRSTHWWLEKNDVDGNGLCEYKHPYSSGLDDSPLWDEGLPVEAPDLNTYLCLEQEALARIAAVLGETQDARCWAEQAEAMARRMLAELWDPDEGIFWAVRRPGGQRVKARTPFNLFPFITGRMPPAVTARVVAQLTDPKRFWTPYPVPTVARDDPHYNPLQMWRGPVWINVNYLLIEGLQRTGYTGLASELRRRTLNMMLGDNDIYEYYNPETGQPPPGAASIFGWSSALFIDMALQEMQGKGPQEAASPSSHNIEV